MKQQLFCITPAASRVKQRYKLLPGGIMQKLTPDRPVAFVRPAPPVRASAPHDGQNAGSVGAGTLQRSALAPNAGVDVEGGSKKPRLKLSTAGTLTVISAGVTGLSQHQTRRLIWRHHGTLKAFAARFNIQYELVCIATGSPSARNASGKIAEVRRLIGLPTSSAKQSRLTHFARAGGRT